VKKKYSSLIMVAVVAGMVFVSSCKEEDNPLPAATASFRVISVAPEVGVPVEFVNESFNADFYVWDYGDGSQTDSGKTVVNGVHTYSEAGTYTVALRAYTQDDQVMEETIDIAVGERFLTGISILNIPRLKPNGRYWDADSSGADVLVFFSPIDNATAENTLFTPVIENVNDTTSDNATPLSFGLNVDFKINDEDYALDVLDVDSIPDSDPEFEVILGNTDNLIFNPIQTTSNITVEKFDDGTGLILFPWVSVGGTQILLEFEIK